MEQFLAAIVSDAYVSDAYVSDAKSFAGMMRQSPYAIVKDR